MRAVYRKTRLWNYGVADEQRYFQAGDGGAVIDLGAARVGLTICEDIWVPGAPEADEALAGASLIVNPSASPYHAGKGLDREQMIVQRARDNLSAFAFCNLVGGQDELDLRRPLARGRPRGDGAGARAPVRRGARGRRPSTCSPP